MLEMQQMSRDFFREVPQKYYVVIMCVRACVDLVLCVCVCVRASVRVFMSCVCFCVSISGMAESRAGTKDYERHALIDT